MSKHTPGPWRFEVEDDGKGAGARFRLLGPGDSIVVGGCGCCDSPYMDGPYEENARLIAAAPELLSELKDLHRAYVNLLEAGRDRIVALGGDCDPVDRMEQNDPHLRAAKAAIDKAEGSER